MESIRVKNRPTGAWRWLQLVLPLAVAVVSACVVGAPGPARSTSQGDITRPELEQILSESAYQAVEQLRPSWLFYRRTPTISNPNPEPAVYVDQAQLLALDDLRSIPVQDVEQIRFLSSRDATTIYGTGHMWGAIEDGIPFKSVFDIRNN